MRFVLEIDCGGPVFKDDLRGEVINIVQLAAEQVFMQPSFSGFLLATDNTQVGSWRFIDTPAHDPDGVSADV